MRELPASGVLDKISFLRSSGASVDSSHRTYHFLHLTYQEYFAAQFFVHHWIRKKPLPLIDLHTGTSKYVTASEFLGVWKYSPGYDVIWKFVTGLLQSCRDEASLCGFFKAIEAPPRDLLGNYHQEFVVSCLVETSVHVELPSFLRLRHVLEARLAQWLAYARLPTNQVRQLEFLGSTIRAESEKDRPNLDVLEQMTSGLEASLPSQVAQMAIDWFDHRASRSKEAELPLHLPLSWPWPIEVFRIVVRHLKDADQESRMRIWLYLVLRSEMEIGWPEEFLQAIAGFIHDPAWAVQFVAIVVLSNQRAALTESVIKKLRTDLLDDNATQNQVVQAACNSVVRAILVRLRGGWATTKLLALESIRCLRVEINYFLSSTEPDKHLFSEVAHYWILPPSRADLDQLLDGITLCLQDKCAAVRESAIAILKEVAYLEDINTQLIAGLKHVDECVRVAVFEVLGHMLQKRPARQPSDGDGRETVGRSFSEVFSNLLTDFVDSLLGHENEGVRTTGFASLIMTLKLKRLDLSKRLPRFFLDVVIGYSNGLDSNSRLLATRLLRTQALRGSYIVDLEPVVSCLEGNDADLTPLFQPLDVPPFDVPEVRPSEPPDLQRQWIRQVLRGLAASSKKERAISLRYLDMVVETAVDWISTDPALDSFLLQALMACLDDGQLVEEMIKACSRCFGSFTLPENFMQALVTNSGDNNHDLSLLLRGNSGFYPSLVNNPKYLKALFRKWMGESKGGEMTCLLSGDCLRIDRHTGRTEIHLVDPDGFLRIVQELRVEFGISGHFGDLGLANGERDVEEIQVASSET
jgi:hypothetical protein